MHAGCPNSLKLLIIVLYREYEYLVLFFCEMVPRDNLRNGKAIFLSKSNVRIYVKEGGKREQPGPYNERERHIFECSTIHISSSSSFSAFRATPQG